MSRIRPSFVWRVSSHLRFYIHFIPNNVHLFKTPITPELSVKNVIMVNVDIRDQVQH